MTINPYMAFSLVPTIYSKAQSVNEIVDHIEKYPEQITNTPEAMEHSIEFQIEGSGPVGTLSEFRKEYPRVGIYYIYPRKGNGIVKISCKDEKFFVVDFFTN